MANLPTDQSREAWVALISVGVSLAAGLFSGLFGRRLEEWWFRPKLVVDFIPSGGGFRTEGRWMENDVELVEIYVRARVRNFGRIVAKQCRPYLVKLEEVHPSGRTTPTTYFDSLPLRWPGNTYEPRDIPSKINQFFDIVGVLKNRPGWRFGFRERFTGLTELLKSLSKKVWQTQLPATVSDSHNAE